MKIKDRGFEFAAGLVLLGFLLSGILTLKEYGLAWDDALGNAFYGQRYLYFFTTGNAKYLEFGQDIPELSQQPLNLNRSLFRGYPTGVFPPVADTLSALTLEVFGYRLGWLPPEGAFHLSAVLLASLALVGVYLWTARSVGKIEGLAAMFFLAAAPRFWGDMRINIKDVPEAAFFTLALLAYASWFANRKWPRALLAGVLFGLGLGTKPNIVFLPLILVVGLWDWPMVQTLRKDAGERLRFIRGHLLMIGGGAAAFWLTWPFMWKNPVHFIEYLQYFSQQVGRTAETAWSAQPAAIALAVQPEAMLLFGAAGVALVLWRMAQRKAGPGRLLLAWMVIPVARASMPGMENFDGVRHYLEFLPALAILAGMGAGWAFRRLSAWRPAGRWISIAIACVVLVHYTVLHARIYPYPYIYFNDLVGGLSGAERFFSADETSDYLCVTYPKGMRWLSENAPANAQLFVPICGHILPVTRELWLREDIELIDRQQVTEVNPQAVPVYSMFITRPSMYFDPIPHILAEGELVYAVESQGKQLMVIYRLR